MKINDLQQYRENGYINIDKMLKEHPEIAQTIFRETRGSQDREKDWIMLEDSSILLRTSNMEEENIYNIDYSELLIEEIARQVGMPCAHYDLITYKGKRGVYSESVIKDENESMINFASLLINLEDYDLNQESVIIDDVLKSFKMLKDYDDITEEERKQMKRDFLKIAIFDMFTMNIDRNKNNLSVIYDPEKGTRISPIFDNEHSLGASICIEQMDTILNDTRYAKIASDNLEPTITASNEVLQDIEENWKEYYCIDDNYKNYKPYDWQKLVFLLGEDIEDEEVKNFFRDCYKNIDLDAAFRNVELRIQSDIPHDFKKLTKMLYLERKNFIGKSLDIEEELEYETGNYLE